MNQAAQSDGCSGFELMEKLYKICSVTSGSHRSTFDQEKGLFGKVDRNDSTAFTEDSAHTGLQCVGVVDANDFDRRVQECFTMKV